MPATQLSYVGLDMDLYRNTGTNATPVWVLIDNCRDLKRAKSRGEADVSIRKFKERQKEPALHERVYTWQMLRDETDTNYTGLRTNYEASPQPITELAFANGLIATSGTTYFRQECKLFGWDDDEPLEGAVLTDVTAKPCKSAFAPTTVTVP
jgi:hypothetical protein